MDLTALAQTDADAQQRYERTQGADPFPEIAPALLNTADLIDYVAATGMVYPFSVDPESESETLKPASCAIRVLGPYLRWRGSRADNGQDSPDEGELEDGQELILERNSIVYVTLEPMFRLPEYIAGRFNLTIRDVYRGLLVGTGPLVDPGFVGRLSLPLHNLTANDYRVIGGEPIVWMEFTKLSTHPRWSDQPDPKLRGAGHYVAFPKRKIERRSVGDYVRRAADGPIRSSIPELVGEAAQAAQESADAARGARDESQRAREIFRNVSVAAFAALVVALLALFLQVNGYINDAREDNSAVERKNAVLEERLDRLEARASRR